jgi:hypothetical protein
MAPSSMPSTVKKEKKKKKQESASQIFVGDLPVIKL